MIALAPRDVLLAICLEVDRALGYPRQSSEHDRRGGGIHVPIELCVTERYLPETPPDAVAIELDATATTLITDTRFQEFLRHDDKLDATAATNTVVRATRAVD